MESGVASSEPHTEDTTNRRLKFNSFRHRSFQNQN